MGFFSKFFKKDIDDSFDNETPTILWAQADDRMNLAFEKARETFKYFWRELSWEQRRIVPAHGFAAVKVAFSQLLDGQDDPIVEHMWINEIGFDGAFIYGVLVNSPNDLTNVSVGDQVKIALDQMSDWMFSIAGKSYGGFTMQAMRSAMNPKERAAHDNAWGIDFGDYNKVLVAYEQKEHPENLVEHPMSINMKEKFLEHISAHPDVIESKDELGHTLLHSEAIAGNKTSVEVLLQAGADPQVKTNDGKTALDFAKAMNWEHLIPVLS